jgi:DNA-binding GntR family transcriptional regulator
MGSGVENICRVRTVLETLAVELALERLTEREWDLTETERALVKLKEAIRHGDFIAHHIWDLRFHRSYWKLADNNCLTEALEKLFAPLYSYFFVRKLTHPRNGLWGTETGLTDHDEILEALKCRSLSKARKAFKRIIVNMRFTDPTSAPASGEVSATGEAAGIRILSRGKPSERGGSDG